MPRLIDHVAAAVQRERTAEALRPWIRNAVCQAMVHAGAGGDTHQVAQRFGWTERAAVSPTTLDSDLAGEGVAPFLRFLAPRSAAAQLFERGERVNMNGMATVTLPRWASDFPEPAFVAEGAPVPVIQGSMAAAELGPPKRRETDALLAVQDLAEIALRLATDVEEVAAIQASADRVAAAFRSDAAGLH